MSEKTKRAKYRQIFSIKAQESFQIAENMKRDRDLKLEADLEAALLEASAPVDDTVQRFRKMKQDHCENRAERRLKRKEKRAHK